MHENDVNPDIGWPKSPTAIEQAKLAMKDSPAYPVKAAVLLLLLAIICYTGGASDPTPAVPVAGGAQPKPTGSAASQVAAKARSDMVANRGAESREPAVETATLVEQSIDQIRP